MWQINKSHTHNSKRAVLLAALVLEVPGPADRDGELAGVVGVLAGGVRARLSELRVAGRAAGTTGKEEVACNAT